MKITDYGLWFKERELWFRELLKEGQIYSTFIYFNGEQVGYYVRPTLYISSKLLRYIGFEINPESPLCNVSRDIYSYLQIHHDYILTDSDFIPKL